MAPPGDDPGGGTAVELGGREQTSHIEAVIKGVIAVEEGAIMQCEKIIELASGFDPATEDLAMTALADEEEHQRELLGFLKEIEADRVDLACGGSP